MPCARTVSPAPRGRNEAASASRTVAPRKPKSNADEQPPRSQTPSFDADAARVRIGESPTAAASVEDAVGGAVGLPDGVESRQIGSRAISFAVEAFTA
jgi:hypothetical protein